MGGFDGWELQLRLLAAMLAAQGALWLLSRACGWRLRREAVLAGLLLPWIVLWPWIAGDMLLAPTGALATQVPGTLHLERADPWLELHDALSQVIPWEIEVRHALDERRLPFWSDALDGGGSPWANPMAGTLSPIALLARAVPLQHSLLAALAIKMLVALEGAWMVARLLGARRFWAMVAGISFALSGGIVAWGVFPQSNVAAWSPWLVAGALTLARRPRAGALIAAAVAFAALLLSGNPEVALGAGLLAATVALAHLRRRRWRRSLAAMVLAAAGGAALAAPVLLPFLSLLPRTQRAQEHARRVFPSAQVELREPASWFWAYQGGYLLAPSNPQAFGRPFREPFRGPISWTLATTPYAGLVAYAGVALALASRRRRRTTVALIAFAVGVLVLAAGFLPALRIVLAVPLLRLPEYSRFMPVVALALAVAGALGWQTLCRRQLRASRAAVALLLASGLSLALAPRPEVVALWLGLGAGALALAGGRRRIGNALLAVVLISDLLAWTRWMLPRGDAFLFYPRTAAIERIVAEAGAPGGPWRVVGHDLMAYPSALAVYGLEDVRPHQALMLQDYLVTLDAAFRFFPTTAQYFDRFENLEHPFLDFLNARVVISNRYLPPIPGMVEIGLDGTPDRIYRNPEALPRWFLPTAIDLIPRAELAPWVARLRDPRRVALTADDSAAAVAAGVEEGKRDSSNSAAVLSTRADPGAIDLELAPAAGPRLLATSLPGPWGWRARAATGELRTLTVNGAFLGVVVPADVSRVELRFVPPGFWPGCAAAAVAVAGLAGLAWSSRRAAGRRRSAA